MKAYRQWRWFVALATAVCVLWTGVAAAPGDGGGGLAEILKGLGSREFAVRDRAQAELAKLPREQLSVLREAEKGSNDEEVKARLRTRISEIELDALLHPPKVSVDVKDAPLAELAAALNRQMGAEHVQVDTSVRGVPPRVTLKAEDQPFWEILRQLMEGAPISFTTSATRTPLGTINTVKLVPATGKSQYHVVDGVLIAPGIPEDPATGEWLIGFTICTDPRVRLTSCPSMLQVEKAIIQDGSEILAILPREALPNAARGVRTTGRMVATGMPDLVVHCSATFAQAASVKAVKELRGSVTVTVAESEHFVNIDLTKELKPVVTPWGKFTVEKAFNGDLTVSMASAGGADAAGGTATEPGYPARLVLRVLDDQGNTIVPAWSTITATTRVPVDTPIAARGRPAAALEIAVPGKTREVRLPVVVKDLEVPVRGRPDPEFRERPGWGDPPRRR